MRILVIEDSPEVTESVALVLELRWPEAKVISTSRGDRGVELAQKELPDVIILDLGLPDMDGIQVLRQIRGFSNVPLLILTAREREVDKIKALELGADDYIVKPFSAGEFLARVQAVFRRGQMPVTKDKGAEKLFIRGGLRIDFASREVAVGDKLIELTAGEYDLLCELARNEGKVLSTQMLLEKVWGPKYAAETGYVKVYVRSLREKLENEPGNPTRIVDEEGIGYKFVSR